ncbi:MAG TPA: DUF5985 family protein [Bryobacteraceae bacterium]|nr:DUF5985 family protein [Bryobacteraceae bacterium]
MVEGFLLGVIASTSIIAGLFFLKFWKDTRDVFFLAFAAAFLIEGLNHIGFLVVAHPNEGSPWIYIVRLFAFLLILAAILKKNYEA